MPALLYSQASILIIRTLLMIKITKGTLNIYSGMYCQTNILPIHFLNNIQNL